MTKLYLAVLFLEMLATGVLPHLVAYSLVGVVHWFVAVAVTFVCAVVFMAINWFVFFRSDNE